MLILHCIQSFTFSNVEDYFPHFYFYFMGILAFYRFSDVAYRLLNVLKYTTVNFFLFPSVIPPCPIQRDQIGVAPADC
jgi:hypothetical protein